MVDTPGHADFGGEVRDLLPDGYLPEFFYCQQDG